MDETGRPPARLVVRLDGVEPTAVDRQLVGGKAAALARLTRSGHPVPSAAVLTTDAYRAVSRMPDVVALIDRRAAAGIDESDDALIDAAFSEVTLPDDVREAIAQLATEAAGPLAVRSSATVEDAGSRAYPGQFRSLLGVDPDDLEAAVRLVWASLWHRAPVEYRERGRSDDDPAMAVLVTDMVDADVAGVLFTRDPVGAPDDLRLDLVQGTAERLVAGRDDATSFVENRDAAADVARARLGDAVGEIVERSLSIDDEWRTPVDVEFAVDRDGRPWIVQARPVTTAPDPAQPDAWVSIDEMLPGDLPPLLRHTAAAYVDEGLRNLFAGLGTDLSTLLGPDGRFISFCGDRAVADECLVAAMTDRATRTDGPTRTDRTGAGVARRILDHRRIATLRRSAVTQAEIVVRAVDTLVAAPPEPTTSADAASILAVWERVHDLGRRTTTAEIAVAAVAVAAHDGVRAALARHIGVDRADHVARDLTTPRVHDPLDDQRATTRPARSGSRAVFGGSTWADDPDLARLVASPGPTPLRAPRVVPDGPSALRRRFVLREAAEASALLERRDTTKAALLELGGIAHRLTVAIGEALAAAGTIGTASDVWWLTPEELRRVCSGGSAPADLARRRTTPPPTSADRTHGRGCSTTSGGTRRLHVDGRPASRGRARGPAAVMSDRMPPRSVEPGSVLVARTSDPSWTPLLRAAAAIVVEAGSPLSHVAILARELGIPAVVGAVGVVDEVRAAIERSGRPVELAVNGSTGRVDVLPISPVPTVVMPDDEQRIGVFVTGLVGASALFLAVTSITEPVSGRRAEERLHRRTEPAAVVTAAIVRSGSSEALRSPHASADVPTPTAVRRLTVAAGVVAMAFAAGALRAYALGDERRRVLWAAGALPAVVGGAAVIAALSRSTRRWPDVDPWLRRAASTTRGVFAAGWSDLPRWHRRAVAALATVVVISLVAVVLAPRPLGHLDRWAYDAVGAPVGDPWGPEWFEGVFGRRQVVIPAALTIILLTVRCRVMATSFALVVIGGGLANLGLGAFVGRERPLLGEHPGRADSFPSGHAIEVTLLLGLLPLAIAIATRSGAAGWAVRIASTGILSIMLVDGLRDGSHWPSDHLAGFATAAGTVVLVHAVALTDRAHLGCLACPTSALRNRCRTRGDA